MDRSAVVKADVAWLEFNCHWDEALGGVGVSEDRFDMTGSKALGGCGELGAGFEEGTIQDLEATRLDGLMSEGEPNRYDIGRLEEIEVGRVPMPGEVTFGAGWLGEQGLLKELDRWGSKDPGGHLEGLIESQPCGEGRVPLRRSEQ